MNSAEKKLELIAWIVSLNEKGLQEVLRVKAEFENHNTSGPIE